MGNYLTIGAKFKPYSFDELIRPYQMYGLAYKELEAALEDLAVKSSIWEGMTDLNRDKETHAAYEKYANDVNAQAASLAKEGLNATNRLKLSLLKQRYSKEIVPIELAYAQRKQLLEEDKKLKLLAMLSGSALYSDRSDLLNISLDEIMKNPNLAPQYETQAARIALGAKMALTYTKQLNGETKWEKDPNGLWFNKTTSTGLTQLELIDAANGKSTPRVEALINQAMEALPSNKWSNVDKNQLRSDIILGLYAGIGDTRNEVQRNTDHMDPMQAYQLKRLQEADRLAKLALGNKPLSWESLGSKVNATKSSVVKEFNKDKEFINKWRNTKGFLDNTTIKESPVMILGDAKGESFKLPEKESRISVNPNRALAKQLFKKYGTNNLSEIENKINKGILMSTSKYKESVLKMADPTYLNKFLYTQLVSGNDANTLNTLITDDKGKKIDVKDRDILFKDGLIGYDFNKKKITMNNPNGTVNKAYVDNSIVANIPIVLPNGLAIPGNEYLKQLNDLYDIDPSSDVLNNYLNYFYDSLEKYGNTFAQKGSGTNTKVTVPSN